MYVVSMCEEAGEMEGGRRQRGRASGLGYGSTTWVLGIVAVVTGVCGLRLGWRDGEGERNASQCLRCRRDPGSRGHGSDHGSDVTRAWLLDWVFRVDPFLIYYTVKKNAMPDLAWDTWPWLTSWAKHGSTRKNRERTPARFPGAEQQHAAAPPSAGARSQVQVETRVTS